MYSYIVKIILNYLIKTKEFSNNLLSPNENLYGFLASKMMNFSNKKTSIHAINYLNIKRDSNILEVGPGNGWALSELIKKSPKRLIAIEISKRFIKEIKKLRFSEKIEIYEIDLIDTSNFIQDETIDYIIAINVIYFLNPLDNYLNEIYRILNKNGKAFFVCKEVPMKRGNKKIFINNNLENIINSIKNNGFKVNMEKFFFNDKISNYIAIIAEKNVKIN